MNNPKGLENQEKVKTNTELSENEKQVQDTKSDIMSDLEKSNSPIVINEGKLMMGNLDLLDFIKNNSTASEELKNQEIVLEISDTSKISRIIAARNGMPAKLSISKSSLSLKGGLMDIYTQLVSFYDKDKINNIKLLSKDTESLSTSSEDEMLMQANRNKIELALALNKKLISQGKKSAIEGYKGQELLDFLNKDIGTDMFDQPEEGREKYIFTEEDIAKYL